MRVVAAIVLLSLSGGAAGAQGVYLLGAAKVDVTPPPFDAAADAVMFPTCPAAVFTGPRLFGLQELRCQNAERTLKGAFVPTHRVSASYRFTLLARRLALSGPFGPPAGVTVTDARVIDRAGAIATCRATATGMTCRQP